MIMVMGPNKRYLEDQAKQRAREEREMAKQSAAAEPVTDEPDASAPEVTPAADEG
jgi:hypothetical protein